MKDLVSLKRPLSDCGYPIINISASSGCSKSAITGKYYGAGTPVVNSPGFSGSITYKDVINISGFVSRIPTKIKRVISFFCQTQKVDYSREWKIECIDTFPEWKMDEIERMFQAQNIVIDGQQVVFNGDDAIFTSIYNSCQNLFKLSFNVNECNIQQIYGCDDSCVKKDHYINITNSLFSTNLANANYYNSNKVLIAKTDTDFINYVRNLPNVTDVSTVDSPAINCNSYKLLKIEGTDIVPEMFYVGDVSERSKIFLRSVSDISELCNGQDSTMCDAPTVGTVILTSLTCDAPTLGTVVLTELGVSCSVSPATGWSIDTDGVTNIIGGVDSNTIALSIKSSDFVQQPGSTTPLSYSSRNATGAIQCTINVPNGIGATIDSVLIDGVTTTKYSFDNTTGTLTLSTGYCLNQGSYININYHITTVSTPYSLSGQTVANISGGCLPLENVYLTNSCNSTIPQNVTILIQTDGQIKWWGTVNYSDTTQSKINVSGLVYSTI